MSVFQRAYLQDIANFLASYVVLEKHFRTWVVRLGEETGGLSVSVAPMKQPFEVARKALSDGFTSWPDEATALTSFKDIVRGRIIVADEAQLQKVLMTLANDTTISVVQFKNNWLKPKGSGFRDYTLILELNDIRGRYAELQVVARELVVPEVEIAGIGKGEMSHISHVLYEKVRMIFGDGRDSCERNTVCNEVYQYYSELMHCLNERGVLVAREWTGGAGETRLCAMGTKKDGLDPTTCTKLR